MKKVILVALAVVMLCSSAKVFGQDRKSGEANLSINLHQVQNIVVENPNVNIDLTTAAEYNNGKSNMVNNHLLVNSTCNYQINVKANRDLQLAGPGQNTIPISTVTLTPFDGDQTAGNGLALSTSFQTFVTSTKGVLSKYYGVNYNVSGGADYINKPEGAYTATITYTISAE
jgi:hypothetical protein